MKYLQMEWQCSNFKQRRTLLKLVEWTTSIVVAALLMDHEEGVFYVTIARLFFGATFFVALYQWVAYMHGQPRFVQEILITGTAAGLTISATVLVIMRMIMRILIRRIVASILAIISAMAFATDAYLCFKQDDRPIDL